MKRKELLVGFLLTFGVLACKQANKKKNEHPQKINVELLSKKIASFAGDNYTKKEDRRFRYAPVDLNGDGKEEVFVGIPNMNYCGSGGCTFFLLDDQLNVKQKFTVSDVPFKILKSKHQGWNDLVINSKGKSYLMEFNNGKYPSNPTVSPLWNNKGEIEKTVFDNYYKGLETYYY
ncbi:hypothetical protein K5X82_02240 [Halosquirtibacter xylanolyticus]|uniref:hypothetical protein n=1 Tax=Halosquirtibacter xylanolyticus TaxID=3374599 RepID=UPI0037499780|nr:hypothetical protein K5X82_02240 [Prolixibacteraceae bacterium]